METRQPYPTDVSDEEWAFVAPYLSLMKENAPQRVYPLREVFNGLRWMVRAGADWRSMPHDLPPWYAVYGQGRRWEKAGVFEAIVHDLRRVLRLAEGRDPEPTAAILDSLAWIGPVDLNLIACHPMHATQRFDQGPIAANQFVDIDFRQAMRNHDHPRQDALMGPGGHAYLTGSRTHEYFIALL